MVYNPYHGEYEEDLDPEPSCCHCDAQHTDLLHWYDSDWICVKCLAEYTEDAYLDYE